MTLSIRDTMADPNLFGEWFGDAESWAAWRAFLSALFGLPAESGAEQIFKDCTGRTTWPAEPFREATVICGRRGGKTQTLALLATYMGAFRDWRPHMKRGERAHVLCVSADRDQARNLVSYVRGLTEVPLVAAEVERSTNDTVEFRNGSAIRVTTASHRTSRGYTAAAVLCDEAAFWRSETTQNPDVEIIRALRPSLATLPGSILITASSPYARRGHLYQSYKDHFGKDDSPVLVWKAPSLRMNPTLDKSIVERAMEADEPAARAEYLAEFRSDVETFISRDVIEAAIASNAVELPPADGVNYFGFVDPSGGAHDSFTLAIAHREGDEVVLDAIRETKPPFSPESVVADYSALLKAYRIATVKGDKYAGQWPRERFQEHGVTYDQSALPKSDLYRELLPVLNGGTLTFLKNDRLVSQLASLERRVARGGRDSIDHGPGGHDDVANAVAGAVWAAKQNREWLFRYDGVTYGGPDKPPRIPDPLPMDAMARAGRPLF